MATELIKWDEIRTQIEQAKDITELSGLSNKLEAIRILAKQSKQSLEVQNKIAEYRLRVERKKGKWLQENIEHEGGRPNKHSTDSSVILKNIHITWDDSSRAQKVASLTDEDFEQYITETKETNKELSLNAVVRKAKQIIREEEVKEQVEAIKTNSLPEITGVYDCIVIDPPWRYNTKYQPEIHFGRVSIPYPEMTQTELLNLKLPSADNCVLWLWTTNKFMKDAYELLEEWGFVPKTILTWDKVNIGVGYWLRNVTEHCILAVKGSPLWVNKTFSTLIKEKRTTHSTKPKVFYEMVNKLCVGSKLDYFARTKRDGWDVYGTLENDKTEVKKWE